MESDFRRAQRAQNYVVKIDGKDSLGISIDLRDLNRLLAPLISVFPAEGRFSEKPHANENDHVTNN